MAETGGARGPCRRLIGKVAVIAGASTGIGRATALRLADEGARLVVGSPASEQALIDGLVAEIAAQGGEAVGRAFDAAEEESAAALIETATSRFGGIDIVHANFADLRVILEDSNAVDVTDAVFDRTLDVDLKGMLRLARHAVPRLLARGGGAMIFTSSTASIMGEPVRPCYAMAKSGLNALIRHLASRWGKEGLRANAILPGVVVTPEKRPPAPTELQRRALELVRAPRLGDPADIAAMVAMLASSDGEWINGQCLAVDGGATLN